MTTKIRQLDFSGQNIYVGMDVHKKQFTVSIAGDYLFYKTFSQPPKPDKLVEYLHRNYPDANYKAVYEAGFCGFWVQEALANAGVDCIVVNPADVPTSDKEKRQKRDTVDSKKLVRGLMNNQLHAINIPDKERQQDRSLLRVRQSIIGNQTRCRNRIKGLLYFFGIEFPAIFEKSGTHWSKRFMKWLSEVNLGNTSSNYSLSVLLKEAEFLRGSLLGIEKQFNALAKEPRYKNDYRLLISIPGIGRIVALVLLTELGEISRFKNLDQICSYIGLVPNVYASGEREYVGRNTKRGNRFIKSLIVESAWVAVRHDPVLTLKYSQLCSKMIGSKAILRIARKLVSRIRYVLINKKEYELGVIA